jgi:hypothetical protein
MVGSEGKIFGGRETATSLDFKEVENTHARGTKVIKM